MEIGVAMDLIEANGCLFKVLLAFCMDWLFLRMVHIPSREADWPTFGLLPTIGQRMT